MGKLIVFEGTDGSGKSTQFSLLTKRLQNEGTDFRTIVFPQYSEQSSALKRPFKLESVLNQLRVVEHDHVARRARFRIAYLAVEDDIDLVHTFVLHGERRGHDGVYAVRRGDFYDVVEVFVVLSVHYKDYLIVDVIRVFSVRGLRYALRIEISQVVSLGVAERDIVALKRRAVLIDHRNVALADIPVVPDKSDLGRTVRIDVCRIRELRFVYRYRVFRFGAAERGGLRRNML